MSGRPPTGSDVARLAGVSKSAVSRAFTGGVVSAEARARILEAARLLKYRPSLTARSLTTSRSRLIGVAITHLENQFYPEVIEKLSDRLAREGFRIVLFITRGEADLDPVLDELLGYRLDGVVLASSSIAARLATECIEANVPVVMFNNVDLENRVTGVSADNLLGAAAVADFLIAAGHRRFAVITGLAESSSSVERSRGFADALARAGMPLPQLAYGEYTFDGAYRAARNLLMAADAPDAIFCVNDHMALAALQAAHDLGRRPGADISIVGFDNVTIAAWPSFSLTSYAQPIDAMVEAVVTQLGSALDGTPLPAQTLRLPGRLVVRKSAKRPSNVLMDASGTEYWIRPAR